MIIPETNNLWPNGMYARNARPFVTLPRHLFAILVIFGETEPIVDYKGCSISSMKKLQACCKKIFLFHLMTYQHHLSSIKSSASRSP